MFNPQISYLDTVKWGSIVKNRGTLRNGIHSTSVFAVRSTIYSIFKHLQQMQTKKSYSKKGLKKKINQCNYLLFEVFLRKDCTNASRSLLPNVL